MAGLSKRLRQYIEGVPKAELHVHIEGTLEPELMFAIAARNGMTLEGTVQSHKDRRNNFKDLQDFLDLYYEACSVLVKEEDFYDLMYAYLRRAAVDNVYVAEIFFDPQTHTERGIPFDVVIGGLQRAIVNGYRDFGIKGSLIMCFLRHLSEEEAIKTLEQAKPHVSEIVAVGLDSGEKGNPPSKFERVYKMASSMGLRLVAHAGEEMGPDYIREALDILHVQRLDHGVQCLKDPALVERLAAEGIPLTTCPFSNAKLQVNARFFGGRNVTKELLDKGLKVTINSDDPAYFGGYITANFLQTASEVGLSIQDVHTVCCNAFGATFLPLLDKQHYLREINHFNVIMGAVAPPKSISIFGSRKPRLGDEAYEVARSAARLFAENGFAVVSGGYSGVMEAVSRGAREGGTGTPVKGVIAPRVFSQRQVLGNDYLTHPVITRNVSDRIYNLLRESEYFLVFGGTIGTVTEMMLVWNAAGLRQIHGGIPQRIFIWRPFWEKVIGGLVDATGIFPEDVSMLTYVDSASEALELIEKDLAESAEKAEIKDC